MNKLLSLRGKMLIFTFGIVVVLMGLSLGVIHHFVAGRVEQQVREDLEKTRLVFETFMKERARWLRSQCEVVAEDPRFTATLDIRAPDLEYQSRTVLREARQFQSIIGSDLFLVTNQEARVLTRLEISAFAGGDLSGLPTLGPALEGKRATGRWRLEGREYRVATAPIREGEEILGSLSVGFTEEADAGELLEDLAAASEDEQIRRPLAADRRTVPFLMREVLDALGGDLVSLVAITDGEGRPVGVAQRRESYGDVLSQTPKIQEALKGRQTMGMQADRGRIVQMVCVPVWSQGEVIGVLGAGHGTRQKRKRPALSGEMS